MRDPLDELRDIPDGVSAHPLPVEEVRRRGDRMRRRRTLMQAVGAAAAVAVVVSGGAFVTGSLSTAPAPPGPATQLPSVSATSSPSPMPPTSWVPTIPGGFPLDRGLPEPGGDIPEREWSDGADTPLSAIACGTAEELPADPVDGLRVEVTPPDESTWRHLLLFEDAAAAERVQRALLSSAGRCSEAPQGAPDDTSGPEEVRWTLARATLDGAPVVEVEGAFYAAGTDVRVPGRILTRVVQVGNAVLVARLDTASSGTGDDPEARSLTSHVEALANEMCLFAADPCEDAPQTGSSTPSPTPEEQTTLTDEQLLTAEEIPFTSRFSFVDSGSTKGGVSRCAQGSWDELGAASVRRRYFVVPERPIETRTAVAEFPDEKTAQAAYHRIQGWIDSCPATLLENGFERASIVDERWTPDYRTPGARGAFAELDYGPAPKHIDPRGEMGYFQSDGVVLVGSRLTWLSLSAVDVEWHFSHDPESTDLPMHPFFTAMPRAAERMARD